MEDNIKPKLIRDTKEFLSIAGSIASLSGIVLLLIGQEKFISVAAGLITSILGVSFSFLVLGLIYSGFKYIYLTEVFQCPKFWRILYILFSITVTPIIFLGVIFIIYKAVTFF